MLPVYRFTSMKKQRKKKLVTQGRLLKCSNQNLKTSLGFSSKEEQTLAPNSCCYASRLRASIKPKVVNRKIVTPKKGKYAVQDREPKELLLH